MENTLWVTQRVKVKQQTQWKNIEGWRDVQETSAYSPVSDPGNSTEERERVRDSTESYNT